MSLKTKSEKRKFKGSNRERNIRNILWETMERWFPEISQELLTSPLSKCQSPARSNDANIHYLASTCRVCDIVSYYLWIKALHSTSWKTLPVTAYAPKKCHTHPKATDVGFSEAKSQVFFFFLTFCWSKVTCFLESWPPGKLIASSGDEKSGMVPAQNEQVIFSGGGTHCWGWCQGKWEPPGCTLEGRLWAEAIAKVWIDCPSFMNCYLLGSEEDMTTHSSILP